MSTLKKCNWENFKDLIGFFQSFKNQAALKLADRKELWGAMQNARLLWSEGSRNKEVTLGKKQKRFIIARILSFRNGSGLSGRLPN